MQMFQAEELVHEGSLGEFFPTAFVRRGLHFRVWGISIRHSDWWGWERDEPLRLEAGWVQAVLDSGVLLGGEGGGGRKRPVVGKFRLELEVEESRKAQLEVIVESLRLLTTLPNPENSWTFVPAGKSERFSWTRSARLNGQGWDVYAGLTAIRLHSVTLAWRCKRLPSNLRTESTAPISSPPPPPPQQQIPTPFSTIPHLPPPFRGLTPLMLTRYHRQRLSRASRADATSTKTAESTVRAMLKVQADAVEDERRKGFRRLMGNWEAEKWRRRWRATGSLLRFLGDAEEEEEREVEGM